MNNFLRGQRSGTRLQLDLKRPVVEGLSRESGGVA